jgi:cysteine desulfurase/selenocysteine lyase
MDRYGIDGTVRASLCFYNTEEEIDLLIAGIEKVIAMFA